MPRRCDIWRVGIAQAPIADIAARGAIDPLSVSWLPEESDFRFLADPFGLWRDGRLHLFAEAYDYRTRHGVIDWMMLDADLRPVDRRTVLREPWHLSYPQIFEADGATWMLPEASQGGRLRLYRAVDFPLYWTRAVEIILDVVPIDATIAHHDGRWWIFYSGGADRQSRMGHLRCAWADRLGGPWHCPPANPIRVDMGGARPGGTPFAIDGTLMLPVQDCRRTYGGAVRILRFLELTPDTVQTDIGGPIGPPAGRDYRDGLHTLSGCGSVTLIDAKRIDRSGRGWLIDLGRHLGWWRGLD
jgi:hypothetical protein